MKTIIKFCFALLLCTHAIPSQEVQASPRTYTQCVLASGGIGASLGGVGGLIFLIGCSIGATYAWLDDGGKTGWPLISVFVLIGLACLVVIPIGAFIALVSAVIVYMFMKNQVPAERLSSIVSVLNKIRDNKELINSSDFFMYIIAKYCKSTWPLVEACDFLSLLLDMAKKAQAKNNLNLKDLEFAEQDYYQDIYARTKIIAQELDKLIKQISYRIAFIYDHPTYHSQLAHKDADAQRQHEKEMERMKLASAVAKGAATVASVAAVAYAAPGDSQKQEAHTTTHNTYISNTTVNTQPYLEQQPIASAPLPPFQAAEEILEFPYVVATQSATPPPYNPYYNPAGA